VVGTYAGTALFANGDIVLAVAPDGTVHVLFVDESSGDNEIYHRFKPAGGAWSPPQNISQTPGTRSDMPEVAVGPDGTVHAVWNDAIGSSQVCCAETYYASRPAFGTWSTPVNISQSAPNEYPNRLAVGSDNTVHVIVSQEDNGPGQQNIYYYAKPPGGSFSAGLNLTGTADRGRGLGGVVATGDGTVHVLYYESWPSEVMYTSKPACGTWSAPVNLTNDPDANWNLASAGDACGTLHVAWVDNAGGSQHVRYVGKPLDGGWSSPVTISAAASGTVNPRLAIDLPRGATTGTVEAVYVGADAGATDAYLTEALLTNCGVAPPVTTVPPGGPALGNEGLIRVTPNPSSGQVQFEIRADASASKLAVYDLAGRKLRELAVGEGAGEWRRAAWDGRDGDGRVLPAGVYVVEVGGGAQSTRVVFVR
jgi:hypothetical protein